MEELKPFEGKILPQKDPNEQKKQQQRNPLNYKIAKCKNFEKDGTCKYGYHCTFAHGDADLRQKSDNMNMFQMNPQMNMPMMFNPMMMDPMALNMMGAMPMGMPMQGQIPNMQGTDQPNMPNMPNQMQNLNKN